MHMVNQYGIFTVERVDAATFPMPGGDGGMNATT